MSTHFDLNKIVGIADGHLVNNNNGGMSFDAFRGVFHSSRS